MGFRILLSWVGIKLMTTTFLNSSTLQLHRSLVPPVDKIPPHLLNFVALWHPQWTKYLLTSSTSLLSGIPSGQNTSSPHQLHCSVAPPVDKIPFHLLNSVAHWRYQVVKNAFSSTPVVKHCSLAPQVVKTDASLAPQVTDCSLALFVATSSPLPVSLAPSNGLPPKFLLYTTNAVMKLIK